MKLIFYHLKIDISISIQCDSNLQELFQIPKVLAKMGKMAIMLVVSFFTGNTTP
jgi:hypothetical protein